MRVGRMIVAAIVGFLFLLFVAIDLVLFGIIPLNSPMVTILALVGLVAGPVLVAAGISRSGRETPPPAPADVSFAASDEPPPPPPPSV